MKVIITESQLKSLVEGESKKDQSSKRPIRYFDEEEYGIPEQIDWLFKQKELIYVQDMNASHRLKLINNIIHNLQKIQGENNNGYTQNQV